MEIVSIILLVLFAPVGIKFIDKTYRQFKKSELYKDLMIED